MDGEDEMEESYIMKGKSIGRVGVKNEIERNAFKEKGEQYHFSM